MASKNYTLKEFWNNGIAIDQSVFDDSINTPDGKMVIRPKFVTRIGLHQALNFVSGYREIGLSTKHLFMVHLGSDTVFFLKLNSFLQTYF